MKALDQEAEELVRDGRVTAFSGGTRERFAGAPKAGLSHAKVDKPAYSLGPHSVRPLRRLAGGRAPSDPAVFRPAAGAAGGGALYPPNPVAGGAAERFPFVADGPADAILAGHASRELGRDLRGR